MSENRVGKKLFDLRDGKMKESSNPALIVLDLLVNPEYGMGVEPDKLPRWQIAAITRWANRCDEKGLEMDVVLQIKPKEESRIIDPNTVGVIKTP